MEIRKFNSTDCKQAETQLQLLLKLIQAIDKADDFHSALEVVLQDVCETAGWAYGEVWIPDTEGSTLECAPVWYSSIPDKVKPFRQATETITFESGIGLPGRVRVSQQSEWIPDVSAVESTLFRRNKIAAEIGLKVSFSVPIVADNNVLAVFTFFLFEAREKDLQLVELVSAIATQLGQVIQRKRAEEALRESEEKFRELTELLPQTIFEIDLQGNYLYSNQQGLESTGYTQEDIDRGLNVFQLIIPEDHERAKQNISKSIHGTKSELHEYSLMRKDGSTFPVLVYSAPIIRTQQPVGLRGIVIDITGRKQAEEELEAYRNHLEELVEERTAELAKVNQELEWEVIERKRAEQELHQALERERKLLEDLRLNLSLSLPHELRTPLTGIIGFSELLTDPLNLPEPERIVDYGKIIYENGLRLNRLVENALLYANLKLLNYAYKDRRSWQSKSFLDIKGFITSIARQSAKDAQRQEDLALELVNARIRILPNNFEKIVTELLDNAFKFSQAGTPVRVTTQVEGDQCLLRIADQGRGMTQEQIADIGAYMQFDRRQHEQQGSGLGLTIASLLAQLEGGKLSIESGLGQGTTVSIALTCESDGQHFEGGAHWVDEGEGQHLEGDAHLAEPIIPPPLEELTLINELAMIGDIMGIHGRIEKIEALDSKFKSFVTKVRKLAEALKVNEIQRFVQQYIEEKE